LSHSIGHAIGATYAIPHGVTSCLSLAPVVRLKASNPDEAKQIARINPYIGKQSTGDDRKDAQVVADAIANLVDELGLKTTLTAVCVFNPYMSRGLTDHSTTCPLARKKRMLLHHELFTVTRIIRTLPTVRYHHQIYDCLNTYISITVKQIIRSLY
jgi:alcohol dehydrogenase YqhD (iron-dependent ADH family)